MLSRSDIKIANSQELRNKLKEPFKLDKSYDIPYVAGYSKDGKTIFIDRHFKSIMNGKDITPFIIIHERVEKIILDEYGFKYEHAHMIAEHIEKHKIKEAGINWKKYQAFNISQYKGIHHEKLQRVPKHLDFTPYKDSHERDILRGLIRVGHISKNSHEN
jgi:hypothetical protein